GFLSRSRSIRIWAPPETSRARWAAYMTSSKRLGTCVMQSSTVTRAMGEPLNSGGAAGYTPDDRKHKGRNAAGFSRVSQLPGNTLSYRIKAVEPISHFPHPLRRVLAYRALRDLVVRQRRKQGGDRLPGRRMAPIR